MIDRNSCFIFSSYTFNVDPFIRICVSNYLCFSRIHPVRQSIFVFAINMFMFTFIIIIIWRFFIIIGDNTVATWCFEKLFFTFTDIINNCVLTTYFFFDFFKFKITLTASTSTKFAASCFSWLALLIFVAFGVFSLTALVILFVKPV